MTCCQDYVISGGARKALGQFLRAIHTLKVGALLMESGKRSFLANAMVFRNRQATDPRDKVFALLGLIPAEERKVISINYNADVLQVYTDFNVNHIRYHGLLDNLSFIPDNQSILNLPSWVPDWRLPINNFEFYIYRVMRLNFFNACSNLKANITTYRLNEELVLKENGICVDSLSHVEGDLKFSTWTGIMKRWYNFAELTLGNSYIAGGNFDDAFWRMVMLDTMLALMTPETSMARVTTKDIEICKRWVEKVYEGRFVFGTDPAEGEISFTVLSAVIGRRFFITQRGYLGLGPAKMQVGDSIYILSGGRCPFVLRKSRTVSTFKPHDGSDPQILHNLLGDCYVQGNMDGEFIENHKDEIRPVYIV